MDLVIRNEWKPAGLVPWSSSKGLESSQVRIQRSTTLCPLCLNKPLPPRALDCLLSTPQHPRHIYKVLGKLDRESKLDRGQRAFLQKTSKLIGELNAQQAAQQAVVHKLSSQAGAFHHSKVMKWVQLDPNSKFANIEKIRQAIGEAAALKARLQQHQQDIEVEKATAALESGLQAIIMGSLLEFVAIFLFSEAWLISMGVLPPGAGGKV